MSTLPADGNFWDPLEGIFDFSLTFEEIALQLIPSGISLAYFPIFVCRYRHDPVYVRSSPLLWTKLILSAAVVACQAAAVGIHKNATADQTDTAIPAASLDLIASINMVMMVYIGHKHSIRSSGLLATYLLFTLAVDILKCRSYFLRGELNTLGGLAATTASLRLLLLIVEERSKRKLLLDEKLRQISGSEATSGYFTRSFFLFLNPMFLSGFSNKLQNADMDQLGLDFSSKVLHAKLDNHWERHHVASTKRRLFWACFYAFRWDLLLILIPRLINIGVTFAQPFLIEVVTETAELDAKQEGYKVSHGKRGGMQFATGLIYITLAVTKVSASHLANRLATKVRGALIAKLMDKTHKISEREANKSAVLTHMSSDIEDIAKGLTNLSTYPWSFWKSPSASFSYRDSLELPASLIWSQDDIDTRISNAVRRRETGSGLVLIDEATSSLDALRDQETRGVLEEAFDDCTVLTIAHRQETIRRVDFTVALDDGEMTTIGAPRIEADRYAAASQH
ncbi:hypothetical protein ARSEF4850_005179 [Beauveria asiatica]